MYTFSPHDFKEVNSRQRTATKACCRHCNNVLDQVFLDLVNAPLSNELLRPDQLEFPQVYYPLKIYVCSRCLLVQTGEKSKPEAIFNNEYAYFSSYSKSWLQHAKAYVDMMMKRFGYTRNSMIIELASNDGYLLQYFKAYDIPVLGVEPSANTAAAAAYKGIESVVDFFGVTLATSYFLNRGITADLVIGNNVLAHVPDINDFVKGMKMILKEHGVITMEFPHLLKLVEGSEFDTIYHEHYSYLSLTTVKRIFNAFGLKLFDVEELKTHGGSLRIYACHEENSRAISGNVPRLLAKEEKRGLTQMAYYLNFQREVNRIRNRFLRFLINKKLLGKKVIGYGAAAKGNTLINYSGLKGSDLLQFVVDASPFKQNKFLPGSQIPIYSKEKIAEYKPDYIIILPWNLREEIIEELDYVRKWGCKFVVFIPKYKEL